MKRTSSQVACALALLASGLAFPAVSQEELRALSPTEDQLSSTRPIRSVDGMTAATVEPGSGPNLTAPQRAGVPSAVVPAQQPSVQALTPTVHFGGTVGYSNLSASTSTVVLTAAYVYNDSLTTTTGTLRLNLWLSTGGYRQTGYSTAKYSMGTLAPNHYFSNISSGTITFLSPPTGCYYASMMLEEYQADGTWSYYDYVDFTNKIVINNASCGTSTICTPSATTACLLNNRFIATLRYRGVFDNGSADTTAQVKPVTGFGNPSYETVFFYFNSANNIEILLKMLDQGNVDALGRPTIAVLFGSATPLRAELTITDTLRGGSRYYTSQFGSQAGTTDFTAFLK